MFIHDLIELPKLERIDHPDGRRYVTPTGIAYPSVTTVLGKTADKSGIEEWKKNEKVITISSSIDKYYVYIPFTVLQSKHPEPASWSQREKMSERVEKFSNILDNYYDEFGNGTKEEKDKQKGMNAAQKEAFMKRLSAVKDYQARWGKPDVLTQDQKANRDAVYGKAIGTSRTMATILQGGKISRDDPKAADKIAKVLEQQKKVQTIIDGLSAGKYKTEQERDAAVKEMDAAVKAAEDAVK